MVDAPAWAKGFDIPWLKEAAAIFREEFKAHSYGAFGIPKDRDIATAREENQFAWTGSGGKLAGVTIFRVADSRSTHVDFAGREAAILSGDLFIRSIAGARSAKKILIDGLTKRANATAEWVECHIENDETCGLLLELGFRHVMTKISASSDLKALFLRTAEDRFLLRAPAPLSAADKIALKIIRPKFITQGERTDLAAELARDPALWQQHYSSYNKRSSWTSFALQGYDPADPGFIIKPSEMSKDWKAKNAARLEAPCEPTAAAKHFPTALAIVSRIPGRKQRVRLMRLGANGGELTRHSDITDREAGTADGDIARLHIPIATDPRCLFRSWGLDGKETRLHLPSLSLAYLDTRKPHAVINPSDIDRIHLVVDVYSSPELRGMIAA